MVTDPGRQRRQAPEPVVGQPPRGQGAPRRGGDRGPIVARVVAVGREQRLAEAGAAVGGAGGTQVYPGGDVGLAEGAGEVVADVVGGCGDCGEVGGGLDGHGEL